MGEANKKGNGRHTAPDTAGRRALRPAPLYYAIARDGGNGLRLLRVPLEFGEEVIVLFSSWETAQDFFLSEVFRGEWYARECFADELVSLLLGLYVGIDWVLLDPFPGCLTLGGTSANLVRREDFVNHLL
jgi:hypothetical protein